MLRAWRLPTTAGFADCGCATRASARILAACALLGTVFVAGCSGSETSTFTLAESQPCLGQLGVTTGSVDVIARGAGGGATALVVDGKRATIMFGVDEREARALAERYDTPPRAGQVRRTGNVVLVWADRPSEAEAHAVEACLAAASAASHRATPTRSARPAAKPSAAMRAARGETLAYSDGGRVYTIRGDGSGKRRIVCAGHYAAWSPDGSRIAFTDLEVIGITRVDGEGTARQESNEIGDCELPQRQVRGPNNGWCVAPAWAPDGHRIACWANYYVKLPHAYDVDGAPSLAPRCGLFVVDLRRTRWQRLLPDCDETAANGAASWSPDGRRLAVAVTRHSRSSVLVLDLETGRVRRLGAGTNPDWSPNGSTIAYATGKAIIAASADGSSRRTVVRSARPVGQPSWSPDGSQIAYASFTGTERASGRLFIIRADGSQRRLLARSGADPDWRPH